MKESANNLRNYHGVERRRHKMFITKNTEYHFRDGLCVAVRDRNTGSWLEDHLALRRPVSGSLKFYPNGAMRPTIGKPRLGEALFFATGGRDVVTSPLMDVARPPKKVVNAYPLPSKSSRRI